jgi:hypothetical protein
VSRRGLETGKGREVFLIDNPDRIAVTKRGEGPAVLACGPQTPTVTVQVEYVAPKQSQAGIQGVLQTITFE